MRFGHPRQVDFPVGQVTFPKGKGLHCKQVFCQLNKDKVEYSKELRASKIYELQIEQAGIQVFSSPASAKKQEGCQRKLSV